MTASTPEYMNCSPNVIGGLIETVSTALLSNFRRSPPIHTTSNWCSTRCACCVRA